jgi:hypothetical protein
MGPGRHRPKAASPHGFKPRPTPQSLKVPHTCVCPRRRPPTGTWLQVRPAASRRRHQGGGCLLWVGCVSRAIRGSCRWSFT